MIRKNSKIYVSGHAGLVGSAVLNKLERSGFRALITRSREDLDLADAPAVHAFFQSENPEYVVACAAKVGGVKDKLRHPAEFLFENTQIQNNTIWAAHRSGVKRLLFISSSSMYAADCAQPMQEERLMEGRPDLTNEAYAYAKIVGAKLCEYIRREFGTDFLTCVPTNIYGEGDNFSPETAHVIPALMHRFHTAKVAGAPSVTVWGDAATRREFLHVDDLADAIVWLLERQTTDYVNIGTGVETSIGELAQLLKEIVGFRGSVLFDRSRPSGAPRRLLDVTRLASTGWLPHIALPDGLERTYNWYLQSGQCKAAP